MSIFWLVWDRANLRMGLMLMWSSLQMSSGPNGVGCDQRSPQQFGCKPEQEWPAAFGGALCSPAVGVLLSPSCLRHRAGRLGGSSQLSQSFFSELHYLSEFCGWQSRPHATSCSRGCLANCLPFPPVVWCTILTGIDPGSVTGSNDWKAAMIRHHQVQWSLLLTSNISSSMPKSRVIMTW